MDDYKITGVVFVDLFTAFDTVDLISLLEKLKSFGFTDHVIGWFRSYLCYRSQTTCVDNKSLSFEHISVDVPKGSVLGH